MNLANNGDRHKILWWLVLIFVFAVPISPDISAKILLFVLLYSIFINIVDKEFFAGVFTQAWDIYVYLSILVVGLTYTEDIHTGLKVLETSLSFLAIPIIIGTVRKLIRLGYQEIFFSFASGVFVACLICLINATALYIKSGDVQAFFFYRLTTIIHSHPTYLAYFIIFSITFGIHFMYSEKNKVPISLFIIALIFFFLMLMLTAGRTSFISMLLIFSFLF